MAWLACTSACVDSTHWIITEDLKTPSYSYFLSSGLWYFNIKSRRTLTQEHRGLTWVAACAMADALTTYDPRFGIGLAGSTYRSAKVNHIDGEEYAVVTTAQIHEAWEGPFISQSAQ